MNHSKIILAVVTILICLSGYPWNKVYSQVEMPEILNTGSLQDQFNYLEDRTRIYNNFRAIREDMFQKIKSNSIDSLAAEKRIVFQLEGQLNNQNMRIDSLMAELQTTNVSLDEAIRNRNRLTFLRIPMQKALYNTIVWIIIAGLSFLSVVLFLLTRRVVVISRNNKNDLEEIKEEFEAYRKNSRERYEKLAVQSHNEIRRLKGK